MKPLENLTAGVAATALLIATLGAAPALAHNDVRPVAAIENVVPGVVTDAVTVAAGATAAAGNLDVTLPVDAADDVVVTGGSDTVSIGLPDAGAATADGGLTVYDHGNGSTTVPVVQPDGGVQIITVIDDASAPDRYSYELGLPPGGTAILTVTGEVLLNGPDQTLIGVVAAPWAVDANGNPVPTRYEVTGTTITQVVDLSDPTIAYPVTADPETLWLWWGTGYKFSYSETQNLGWVNDAGSAAAVLCGLIGSAPGAVACGVGAEAYINGWHGAIRRAAANGNCAQINIPYASGPALWVSYEVTC